ncbi:hypothetical protein ACS0TY_017644 [Phlomoides rotata]
MAKTALALSFVALLVLCSFVSDVAANTIGYPAINAGDRMGKKNSPPEQANDYHRGCNPNDQCRGGG